jgi:DNA-binding PadR family transcriptional regulator
VGTKTKRGEVYAMIRIAQLSPVLNTLDSVGKKHRKGYCYPSQKTLIFLLCRHHQINISIRSLCRWLKRLESEGYIKRKQRIRRSPEGGLIFSSTIYILTRKAYKFLGRLIRQLSHHKRGVSNYIIQQKRPSVSEDLGPEPLERILEKAEVHRLAKEFNEAIRNR